MSATKEALLAAAELLNMDPNELLNKLDPPIAAPKTWTVTFTETITHRVVVTVPDGTTFDDPEAQAAFLLDLARDEIDGTGESVVSSAARFDQAEPGDAWEVVVNGHGDGFIVRPVPRYVANNAIDSVREDQLHTVNMPANDTFMFARYNHPGDDLAAYVRKDGENVYTVAL